MVVNYCANFVSYVIACLIPIKYLKTSRLFTTRTTRTTAVVVRCPPRRRYAIPTKMIYETWIARGYCVLYKVPNSCRGHCDPRRASRLRPRSRNAPTTADQVKRSTSATATRDANGQIGRGRARRSVHSAVHRMPTC